jgi:hypothetical protein
MVSAKSWIKVELKANGPTGDSAIGIIMARGYRSLLELNCYSKSKGTSDDTEKKES